MNFIWHIRVVTSRALARVGETCTQLSVAVIETAPAPWRPTVNLRFRKNTFPFLSGQPVMPLQQQWRGPGGAREWRDVESTG